MENYQAKYKELKSKFDYSQKYLKLLDKVLTNYYKWDTEQQNIVRLIFFYLELAELKKQKKPVLKRKSKKN